jgi:purine-binding chemotaxis protein CheW
MEVNYMGELTATMDQASCPVEYTPAGDSAGVKAMIERESKSLTFTMADEEYGIGILKIKEIVGMMPITSVPQTPKFVKGVINLRGKVIPVVDLRLRLTMEPIAYNDRICIIVVEISGRGTDIVIGIVVDSVSEVLNIKREDIERTPPLRHRSGHRLHPGHGQDRGQGQNFAEHRRGAGFQGPQYPTQGGVIGDVLFR